MAGTGREKGNTKGKGKRLAPMDTVDENQSSPKKARGSPPAQAGGENRKQTKPSKKSTSPASSGSGSGTSSGKAPERKFSVVILEGINKEAFDNPIKLKAELVKNKACVALCDIKPGRNNTLILSPKDLDSFQKLTQQWRTSEYLGNIKPRLPRDQAKPVYAAIAKNVPLALDQDVLEKELRAQGFPGAKTTRFQKKQENGTSRAMKVVKIDLGRQSELDLIVDNGFKLGYLQIKCEKFTNKSSNQCFKCQQWGHSHQSCPNSAACRWCAGPHDSRVCPNVDGLKKCANCKGGHPSHWSGCPARIQKKNTPTPKQPQHPKPNPNQGKPAPTAWAKPPNSENQPDTSTPNPAPKLPGSPTALENFAQMLYDTLYHVLYLLDRCPDKPITRLTLKGIIATSIEAGLGTSMLDTFREPPSWTQDLSNRLVNVEKSPALEESQSNHSQESILRNDLSVSMSSSSSFDQLSTTANP
jgi:hypothetical protein